jgi:hypothetical protein
MIVAVETVIDPVVPLEELFDICEQYLGADD